MCGPDINPEWCKCKKPVIYTVRVFQGDSTAEEMLSWATAIHKCKVCGKNFKDTYTLGGFRAIAKIQSLVFGPGAALQIYDKKYSKFYTDEVVVK